MSRLSRDVKLNEWEYRWYVSCPVEFTRDLSASAGRVMLDSGPIPAILSRRDGADDESSRRALEGDGEEDHLAVRGAT